VLDKDKRAFVVDVGMCSVQQRSSTGDAPTTVGALIIFSIPLQVYIYIYISMCVCVCVCVCGWVCVCVCARARVRVRIGLL
jgi:hypothetical protein